MIVALILGGGAVVLASQSQIFYPSTGSSGSDLSTQCPTSQYANNEDSSGAFHCSQVGYNQLNNFPSACSSNQFVTSITTTLVCKNYFPNLVSSNFISGVTSTSNQQLFSYTPSSNGIFEITGFIDIGLISGGSNPYVQLRVQWVDSNGTSQTTYIQVNGANINYVIQYNANQKGYWTGLPWEFKSGQSPITLVCQTNGSPVSIEYDCGGTLMELSST